MFVGGWWDGFRIAQSMMIEYTMFSVLVAFLLVLVLAAALRYRKFSDHVDDTFEGYKVLGPK